ncbi:UDP-N-acetylmuramoyl-L-alanine--D-glutamate ligase [Halioglobus maricola]|uniref:UDP-N-acetylmuramoylalanine--D-glutamate ligase n=1 Tax=Halioglobus maricola TaxID=2601894 RepID=A0A5P9NGP6_9GAMM|nr:UDP-N-acetylmuramoyl-L-alanine--D-glutamate ligase [Halioglobus maricola]QFU74980.1 UDP-N-acetylmuramoyl-L-alanine--D-glutamate ligase [Halioglobus maricola]
MTQAVVQDVIASSVNRVVVGLGVTGLSCARFLHKSGQPFAIVDTREKPPGLAQVQAEMPDVPVYLGEFPAELLTGADELIVSPGIAPDDQMLAPALEAGATLVGDIDLFVAAAQAPVVGITGSNAKSTVTELVGAMALEAGLDVGVGGNLGTPALDLLAPARDLYVLELSSFQLERAGNLGLEVATVLNVSADHLDRHGNLVRYHQAKHRIFQGCRKVVVNRSDPLTVPLVPEDVEVVSWRLGEPELHGFGLRDGYLCYGAEPLLAIDELGIVGLHNQANALAALALGRAAGLPVDAMCRALKLFRGLPHRCELVARLNDVSYVNDSKGTNVGATQAALAGLGGERDVLLIAGGQGKGADFSAMRRVVQQHCKHVLLIGEDAALLEEALGPVTEILRCEDMAEAVRNAAALAAPGETILLSPACASFDMYPGFAARGDAFREAVSMLEVDA